MARNSGPRIPDDELVSRPFVSDSEPGARYSDPQDLDPRLLDLETEQDEPFHRSQRRVPVRRGALPRKAADRIKAGMLVLCVLGILGTVAAGAYRYGTHSLRFRLDSGDEIEVLGAQRVGREQILEVMSADIGRNVFFIPLDRRRGQIEEIPWVESAAVSRMLPNRLRVSVRERVPVAFAKIGSKIHLVDAHGMVMELPPAGAPSEGDEFSFPVILGISDSEPPSERVARMKVFTSLVQELDSSGAHYSRNLSEVDLSDPEDVKITTADGDAEVLIHLGSSDFLGRYQVYIANVQTWRQQYQTLHSVDLRYDRQVILNAEKPRARAPASNPSRRAPAKTGKKR
jgi:cell division protein FtsQ